MNISWQVNAPRLKLIAQIEKAGQQLRISGAVDKWFCDDDAEIRRVCKGVNGHLLEVLLRAAQYPDIDCLNLLRHGLLFSSFVFHRALHCLREQAQT